MLFNSFEYFFLFLPLTAITFYVLRTRGRTSAGLGWLLLCSIGFYAWGGLEDLPLLLVSILFNYAIARYMRREHAPRFVSARRRRQALLAAGIAGNLTLLAYFKYFSHLPLGISFFTLVQVIYLVDTYEELITPSALREHALCTALFATVSMGPIVRIRDLRPQFTGPCPAFSSATLATAIAVFAVGLFKKVVIADSFGRLADAAFAVPSVLSVLEAWAGSCAYSLQLYFDFSGYSDMAIGSALFLGVTVPTNFNSPYFATSIVDFWRRWHMSLTNFITTYLYTPLVRSLGRITFAKAMLATFFAMVLVGIWHGSTWNFVIFGALHGAGLVVNHVWRKLRLRLPRALAWALTFAYVNVAFVFFRAPTLPDALSFLGAMVDANSVAEQLSWTLAPAGAELRAIALPLLIGLVMVCQRKNSTTLVREFHPSSWNLAWVTLITLVSLLYLNTRGGKEFIYHGF